LRPTILDTETITVAFVSTPSHPAKQESGSASATGPAMTVSEHTVPHSDADLPRKLSERASQEGRKIFGIGLSRTGTTSLHLALGILGFRSIHYPRVDRLRELLQDYDAAVDTPVACSYPELDELYPGSRYVLTVRDFRSWLASTEQFFSRPPPQESWLREVRLRTYGSLEWDRQTFLKAYHRHIETVMDYFKDRPNVLVIMNIVAGEGWDVLCPFLGLPVPSEAFPHANGSLKGFEGKRDGPSTGLKNAEAGQREKFDPIARPRDVERVLCGFPLS
jgi:hypothetical protein